jgi:TPR repeat protein
MLALTIGFLFALFLPSEHVLACSPSDISAADPQKLQTHTAQGDEQAQSKLGWKYQNENGVSQDYAMVRQWFEKAAAQGYVTAQVNLVWMYFIGHGVPKDFMRAWGWHQKSAAQGDKIAPFSLGIMYGKGLGVQQNDVKAIMWLTLLAASADYSQEITANIRDEIARRMTPTPLAEAQRLVQQRQA